MAFNEKGRPAEGSPIPKIIPRQEQPEFTTAQRVLQASRLICRMTLDKRYGPQPLVVVTVKAVQS
jgi:hypothetical protein